MLRGGYKAVKGTGISLERGVNDGWLEGGNKR
jgi:hypothetical protein